MERNGMEMNGRRGVEGIGIEWRGVAGEERKGRGRIGP
jgi:hypothetical protein